MFDRLGDLLSEALEKGALPKSEEASRNENPGRASPDFSFHEEKEREGEKAAERGVSVPRNVKSAMGFIRIPEEADFKTAKKIYRERLMSYHPDRRNGNPVLQKVAKEKTERLLNEWKTVEKWFSEKTET